MKRIRSMTIPLLPDDPHDQILRQYLKPSDWVNPTPLPRYQLVVIGGGPAGLVCAAGAAGLGARVAMVERDLLGGDCLNVGCVPSKALLRTAKAVAAVRQAGQFGIRVAEPMIDFAAVMEWVRRVRAGLASHDSAERFRSLGVDVFLGEGKFLSEDTIEANGSKLKFGRCVIATGARPVMPDIPGLRESRWFTNESIFTLTELPKSFLVLGSGPVGCELAQAFARLGSKVTLYSRSGRVLPKEDQDAAQVVKGALRSDGVEFATEQVSPSAYDAVLVATGRQPNIENLNLEAAGVASDLKAGVRVDDYLRTTNHRVFAAGDVASLGYKFTHAADAMARLVIRNALFPTKARAASLIIPWCTYTEPEIGRVGLSEEEARTRNVAVTVFRHDSSQLDRASADGAETQIKVLVQKGSDRILGATVVGPHAGELTGTLSVAMTSGIGLKTLANTVFPYPTYTEAIKKIGDQYNRSRLTPRAKRLIGKWLRWFR
jgi:pyruvate/2-oxoglutarate dehydrogenase complex dihydrolipoamide dehydrogenase (E3) component